jgi:hypothetical protein
MCTATFPAEMTLIDMKLAAEIYQFSQEAITTEIYQPPLKI